MHQSRQGFTLIELLIVVAIIGILAAVLIPNLQAARQRALERAAQLYSSSVYKALNAVLASNVMLTADDVADADFSCGAQAPATTAVVVGGQTFIYGWSAAPVSVTDCTVATEATGGIEVTVATALVTYVNGVPAP